ncbi:flavin reductase like domain-containing protein [Desarmillaria tabescens]|uniref:Flavin reductase like domain-containing protein n=1 Tax=Armillaria tabescens TaxID=1929756 RepID=A0AA39JDT7_ARMTA|nr:flavin reductase like domain-containing protein [Desarmillaria tabescens]KAK0440946.1 flavin reductase like domain-containing protein [Desarmillaria tabescens]
MRRAAQPVAVVTALTRSGYPYHGATLSSFTSIALDPHPLVAFSLRMPSRLANAIQNTPPDPSTPHLVVNILAEHQPPRAEDFVNAEENMWDRIPHTHSEEGIPILSGSLGAVSCRLVTSPIPLHDLEFLESGMQKKLSKAPVLSSQLYLAQVLRVEKVDQEAGSGREVLPLIYRHRTYTTCLHSDKPT